MQKMLFILFVLMSGLCAAQVPKMGNDTLIDIACWNTEWFGDTQNGPTDENVQYNNVKTVLINTAVDVWGLCEVSDMTTYNTLYSQLSATYAAEIATYSQTQKTALFWRKSMFDKISAQHVLTGSTYSYAFASRPPLEVVLKTKNTATPDTIYFYVLHMKALADQTSYDRRGLASGYLKTFLDANPKRNIVVLGDWNDDLDASTFKKSGVYQPSPYGNFVNDTNYYFTTLPLSLAGKKSYAFINGSFIDHILIGGRMKEYFVKNSTIVMDNMGSYISNFSNNTSDHYPVISYFNNKRPVVVIPPDTNTTDTTITDTTITDTTTTGLNELTQKISVTVYPNPSQTGVYHITSASKIHEVVIADLSGRIVWQTSPNASSFTLELPSSINSGVYFMHVFSDEGHAVIRVMK